MAVADREEESLDSNLMPKDLWNRRWRAVRLQVSGKRPIHSALRGTGRMDDGMSTSDFAAAEGEYSVDDDNQLQPEDTLVDRGVDDVLDEGYSPPERAYERGHFADEEDPAARLNSLFDDAELQRSDDAEREAEFPEHREVGGRRAGRLVAPDQGFGPDIDAELIADDVGISGGAASAEEAAVHIVEDIVEDGD
ncbi:Uncharacterised protein [Mycolicibacterium gilvum]|uniref:DUF5709 domain-containing protein n=2 Tax=Mycolicibacterium gilvum TaxID=1804 RepID=A0A378SGR2_9MYCO|nr:Uncharacterised protein [Mycolicibacterium gilvum]